MKLAREQKRKSHSGHLGFQDGHLIFHFENCPIELEDLTNVCLDTKIMSIGHLEAEI